MKDAHRIVQTLLLFLFVVDGIIEFPRTYDDDAEAALDLSRQLVHIRFANRSLVQIFHVEFSKLCKRRYTYCLSHNANAWAQSCCINHFKVIGSASLKGKGGSAGNSICLLTQPTTWWLSHGGTDGGGLLCSRGHRHPSNVLFYTPPPA